MTYDSFTERFMAEVRHRRPEWLKDIRSDVDAPGSVVLRLDKGLPNGPVEIFTENEEITVTFAGMHDHFGNWTGASESEATAEAISFVDRIIADEEVVVVTLEQGIMRRGWTAAPGKELEQHKAQPGEVVQVRSWSGRHDWTIGG